MNRVPYKPKVRNTSLTPRELEILSHLVSGHSNAKISSIMGITVLTVKRHLTNIFDKSGMDTRLELAMWSVHKNIIPFISRTEINQEEVRAMEPF